jgi:hypothetical protein
MAPRQRKVHLGSVSTDETSLSSMHIANEWRWKMHRFLAVMALASLVTTPALAQSYDPDIGSGNIAPAPYAAAQTTEGFQAMAQAPRYYGPARTPSAPEANVVRDSQGNVVGVDPDINIRSALQRDNRDTEW